ncbi:hypothetical protein LCGC14_0799250 [marine sediment metagenome]|uniref:Uncharacterized protein n=1 Tax=marine sediment metagenome TaxID=412755 RepID=A0A0F9QA23_9ZZZZ
MTLFNGQRAMSRKRFEKIRQTGLAYEYDKAEYWFWEYMFSFFGEPL